MAAISRGKKILKKSVQRGLEGDGIKKAENQTDKAKWWIDVGLDQDGFKLKFISDYIGYGVFATKKFEKGDFLLEYKGSLVDHREAKILEAKHAKDNEGCFMFDFTYKGKSRCIDATEWPSYIGRMVNDSEESNAAMRIINVKGSPHLCLFATKDISIKEQIMYDYGVNNVHWRKQKRRKGTKRTVTASPSLSDVENSFDRNYVPSTDYSSSECEYMDSKDQEEEKKAFLKITSKTMDLYHLVRKEIIWLEEYERTGLVPFGT